MDIIGKLQLITEVKSAKSPKISLKIDRRAIAVLITQQEITLLTREAWNSLRVLYKDSKLCTPSFALSVDIFSSRLEKTVAKRS